MILLILIGAVYVLLTESLPVAVLVAALILYRAQRPSQFLTRARDAWYAQRAASVSAEDVRD